MRKNFKSPIGSVHHCQGSVSRSQYSIRLLLPPPGSLTAAYLADYHLKTLQICVPSDGLESCSQSKQEGNTVSTPAGKPTLRP